MPFAVWTVESISPKKSVRVLPIHVQHNNCEDNQSTAVCPFHTFFTCTSLSIKLIPPIQLSGTYTVQIMLAILYSRKEYSTLSCPKVAFLPNCSRKKKSLRLLPEEHRTLMSWLPLVWPSRDCFKIHYRHLPLSQLYFLQLKSYSCDVNAPARIQIHSPR